jgi:hypothetical protein
MVEPGFLSYVAECFWPGVTENDLRALDERAQASSDALARRGELVRYRGSILMREDEVVLCQFDGAAASVRRAVDEAHIPCERILETTCSPWPIDTPAGSV